MLFHERWYPLLRDTSLGFLPTPPRPCRGQASWMLPEMSPVWSQKMYLKISKSGYQNLRAFRATAAFRVDQHFRSWNSTILEYILDQAAKNWLNRWIPGLKYFFFPGEILWRREPIKANVLVSRSRSMDQLRIKIQPTNETVRHLNINAYTTETKQPWPSQKKKHTNIAPWLTCFVKNSQSLVFWCCDAVSETPLTKELDDMEPKHLPVAAEK